MKILFSGYYIFLFSNLSVELSIL